MNEKLYEIKTIKHIMPCKCGKGDMIGTGGVRWTGTAYEHQHRCSYSECDIIEWLSTKYPYRSEIVIEHSQSSVVSLVFETVGSN